MKLTAILEHAGDSIMTQRMDVAAHKAVKRKSCVDVTFSTQGFAVRDLMFPEQSQYVGLIVWIPREKWVEAFDKEAKNVINIHE